MSDRLDEMKGKAKEAVGGATDNEEMEAEGKAEQTEAKAKREAKGAADQVKGKAKELYGDVTDDKSTELEGEAQQKKGDIERAG